MSFSIYRRFAADTPETYLLFTLCLTVWLSTRLSARDEHFPRSSEQKAQDKSAGRTAFESAIRIVSEAPRYMFLVAIVAPATALFYALKPALTYIRTLKIYAEQHVTPVLHETESLITQSKDEIPMWPKLLRLTHIPASAYEELGIKKMKTLYRIDSPTVYYGRGLFNAV